MNKLRKGTYKPTGNGGGAAAHARTVLRCAAAEQEKESRGDERRARVIIHALRMMRR
jgi:hypothetical protein